jgi:hypothetical protein
MSGYGGCTAFAVSDADHVRIGQNWDGFNPQRRLSAWTDGHIKRLSGKLGSVGGGVFNLIVRWFDWDEGQATMPLGRMFEYTEADVVEASASRTSLPSTGWRGCPAFYAQRSWRGKSAA